MKKSIFRTHLYKIGDRKPIPVHLLTTHQKKLKKLTKEYPELIPLIDHINYQNLEKVIDVLKQYDELVKQTN